LSGGTPDHARGGRVRSPSDTRLPQVTVNYKNGNGRDSVYAEVRHAAPPKQFVGGATSPVRRSKFDARFSKNSDKLLAERQIFHPRGRGGVEHVDNALVLGFGVRADDDGVFVAEFVYCIP
jgi:hypothetical protein